MCAIKYLGFHGENVGAFEALVDLFNQWSLGVWFGGGNCLVVGHLLVLLLEKEVLLFQFFCKQVEERGG